MTISTYLVCTDLVTLVVVKLLNSVVGNIILNIPCTLINSFDSIIEHNMK